MTRQEYAYRQRQLRNRRMQFSNNRYPNSGYRSRIPKRMMRLSNRNDYRGYRTNRRGRRGFMRFDISQSEYDAVYADLQSIQQAILNGEPIESFKDKIIEYSSRYRTPEDIRIAMTNTAEEAPPAYDDIPSGNYNDSVPGSDEAEINRVVDENTAADDAEFGPAVEVATDDNAMSNDEDLLYDYLKKATPPPMLISKMADNLKAANVKFKGVKGGSIWPTAPRIKAALTVLENKGYIMREVNYRTGTKGRGGLAYTVTDKPLPDDRQNPDDIPTNNVVVDSDGSETVVASRPDGANGNVEILDPVTGSVVETLTPEEQIPVDPSEQIWQESVDVIDQGLPDDRRSNTIPEYTEKYVGDYWKPKLQPVTPEPAPWTDDNQAMVDNWGATVPPSPRRARQPSVRRGSGMSRAQQKMLGLGEYLMGDALGAIEQYMADNNPSLRDAPAGVMSVLNDMGYDEVDLPMARDIVKQGVLDRLWQAENGYYLTADQYDDLNNEEADVEPDNDVGDVEQDQMITMQEASDALEAEIRAINNKVRELQDKQSSGDPLTDEEQDQMEDYIRSVKGLNKQLRNNNELIRAAVNTGGQYLVEGTTNIAVKTFKDLKTMYRQPTVAKYGTMGKSGRQPSQELAKFTVNMTTKAKKSTELHNAYDLSPEIKEKLFADMRIMGALMQLDTSLLMKYPSGVPASVIKAVNMQLRKAKSPDDLRKKVAVLLRDKGSKDYYEEYQKS